MTAPRFRQSFSTRLVFAGIAVAAAAFQPREAAAATELAGATIEVKSAAGAESCPDAPSLTKRMLLLGKPPERTGEALVVEVAFRREGSNFAATLKTSGRTQGTRELSAAGENCEPLAAATSVVLAVLLELLPQPAPAAPPAEILQKSPSTSDVAPERSPYLSLGVTTSLAYGLVEPAFGSGFGGELRLRLPHAEIELGGFWLPRQILELTPGFVNVTLAGGSVGFCGYLTRDADTVELGACGALLLGSFAASGAGFYKDLNESSFWIAGSIGATLSLPLRRHWAIRVALDVIIPFRQHELEVARVGRALTSPLAVAVGFGPEFRFR